MSDAGEVLNPWWVTMAVGVASTLVGAIGKLWSENRSIRAELAAANERVVTLQLAASQRSDAHQSEHRRDLRRLAGLSTSMDPPPLNPFAVYPVIIEADDERVDRSLPPKRPPRPRARKSGSS